MPSTFVPVNITEIPNSTAPSAERYAIEKWQGALPTFVSAHTEGNGDKALLPYWRQNTEVVDGKAYECACTTLFTRPVDVVRHIRREHFNEDRWQCNHCELTGNNPTALDGAHQDSKHNDGPKKYQCRWEGCGAAMADKSYYYKHLKKHPADFAARERELVSGKVATAQRAQRTLKGTKSATLKREREDDTLQREAGSEEELAEAGSSRKKRARGGAKSTAGSLRAPAGALPGVTGAEQSVTALLLASETTQEARWNMAPPSWMSGNGTVPALYQAATGFGDVPVDPQLLEMNQFGVLEPRAVLEWPANAAPRPVQQPVQEPAEEQVQEQVQELVDDLPSAVYGVAGEDDQFSGLFGEQSSYSLESWH